VEKRGEERGKKRLRSSLSSPNTPEKKGRKEGGEGGYPLLIIIRLSWKRGNRKKTTCTQLKKKGKKRERNCRARYLTIVASRKKGRNKKRGGRGKKKRGEESW